MNDQFCQNNYQTSILINMLKTVVDASVYEKAIMDSLLEPPDKSEYYCSPITKSSGFTLAMKLVLMTRKHPKLHEYLRAYFQENPSEINRQNALGWTPLMLAARNSNRDSTEQTVEILLQAGANVDINDQMGNVALMKAVRYCGTDSTERTVELLIDANANVNIQENQGWTALMLAVRHSKSGSSEKIVQTLLDAKAHIDYQNRDGWTALMIAAVASRLESSERTVEILIQAGADVDFTQLNGYTPLMKVVQYYETDSTEGTIRLLLNANCNINHQTENGLTALAISYEIGNKNLTKILLDAGAKSQLELWASNIKLGVNRIFSTATQTINYEQITPM